MLAIFHLAQDLGKHYLFQPGQFYHIYFSDYHIALSFDTKISNFAFLS